MKKLVFALAVLLFGCKSTKTSQDLQIDPSYDESKELRANADHPSERMQYKLIQSKVLDRSSMWESIVTQLEGFGEEDYKTLKPLIYETDINRLQQYVHAKKLSYESIVKWYLYRIHKFESDPRTSLHAIIAINPEAVEHAKLSDRTRMKGDHLVNGLPILLKDNINSDYMNTTAGAEVFKNNKAENAFIVEQLEGNGAIILGKVNLSEWAYYLCEGCPLGYSAIGGQSLNPYGRRVFETGGSSAASGTSMAANYAVGAVGTETSGSILSPSSQNSIVGFKPTIGVLSRSGIVPISSTLDTPGPMTRNVSDNAILLSAMVGEDPKDNTTLGKLEANPYFIDLIPDYLKGKRLGVNETFLSDSIYAMTVKKMESYGAELIPFTPGEMDLNDFGTFLNYEMKRDLPKYIEEYLPEDFPYKSVKDIVIYNNKDIDTRVPYGQSLFEGIVSEGTSPEEYEEMKLGFREAGVAYFSKPMDELKLDAILSINNYNAGQAAMAQFPCLTVPMGYKPSGEPLNLTFIGRPFEEHKLLKLAYSFEQSAKVRIPPKM